MNQDISFAKIENNIELAYQFINSNENQEKPLIVFLHEGLGSIAQWKDFPLELCKKVNLEGFIYERQGYANSSALTETRDETYLENYALEELPKLIKTLNLENRKLILFGHSDGGSIAYIYAGKYPENIVGIITEAAHVFVEDITLNGISPVVDMFENWNLKEKLARYQKEKTEQIFYAWSDTWHKKQFKNWNIEHYLSPVTCPVLAIQGIDDEYGTELQVDKIINGVSGKAQKLMIPNCGHIPHFQQREIIIEESVKFLFEVVL